MHSDTDTDTVIDTYIDIYCNAKHSIVLMLLREMHRLAWRNTPLPRANADVMKHNTWQTRANALLHTHTSNSSRAQTYHANRNVT